MVDKVMAILMLIMDLMRKPSLIIVKFLKSHINHIVKSKVCNPLLIQKELYFACFALCKQYWLDFIHSQQLAAW